MAVATIFSSTGALSFNLCSLTRDVTIWSPVLLMSMSQSWSPPCRDITGKVATRWGWKIGEGWLREEKEEENHKGRDAE